MKGLNTQKNYLKTGSIKEFVNTSIITRLTILIKTYLPMMTVVVCSLSLLIYVRCVHTSVI